jgi:tRNA pseudouridine13 synthase
MDESIGLSRFATNLPGINGVLKMRAEDFRVEEVGRFPALDPKGRFTLVKVTLRDWETNRFVRRFTSSLKISRNRIWFSGTKDKKAVTTQLMVVDAPIKQVESVQISDVEIEILGRTHQKVAMGAHSANRFTIVVRGCVDENGEPLDARDAMSRA